MSFKIIGVMNQQPISRLLKRDYPSRAEAEKAVARLLKQSNVARAYAVPAR